MDQGRLQKRPNRPKAEDQGKTHRPKTCTKTQRSGKTKPATLDPYCIYLVGKPRKIMWHTVFDYSFDFSMVLTLRGLILFFVLSFMFSHSHACEPHAVEFDKFLRALMASDLNKLGLEDVMEWLMLHAPQLLGGHIA